MLALSQLFQVVGNQVEEAAVVCHSRQALALVELGLDILQVLPMILLAVG